jgi:tRNA dimethylallyltransferase
MKTSGEKNGKQRNGGAKERGSAPSLIRSFAIRHSLLVIVGPTAVGKTALSLQLAKALGGEIVSADSRLLYRGMDIGTAKPTPEERARVPHHLIDVADPDETVGLAEYQDMAYAAIDAIHERGNLPLLVGGTGQYVQAVVEGWRIPRVPPHPDLRAALEAKAEREDPYALHDWLKALDPAAAEDIHPHNVRRVVRALEVCLVSGVPISEQQGKEPPPYRILQIGLTREREALYERIDRRLEAMLEAGLEEEVRRLREAGYDWELPAMSAVGYSEFEPYFEGEATLDEVIAAIKHDTRRFVRHQYNWFSLDDPDIRWFDAAETSPGEIEAVVRAWLRKE